MASGAAAERNRSSGNPPPIIGKAGRYTVFIKAPPSPKPVNVNVESQASPAPAPSQLSKPPETSLSSFYSMFSSAVTKIQNVHSAVDEYLADWFGLNQSKYQWALDDYFEAKEMAVLDKSPFPQHLWSRREKHSDSQPCLNIFKEIGDEKPKEDVAKGQEMQQIDEQVMKRDDQPLPEA